MVQAVLVVSHLVLCYAAWGDSCCKVENGKRMHNVDNGTALSELRTFPPWPVKNAIDYTSKNCSTLTETDCDAWSKWDKGGGCHWDSEKSTCLYVSWNNGGTNYDTMMAKLFDIEYNGKEEFHVAFVGAFFGGIALSSGRIATYHINNRIDEHCPGLKATLADTTVNKQNGDPDPGFVMTYDGIGMGGSDILAYVTGGRLIERMYNRVSPKPASPVTKGSDRLVDAVIGGLFSGETMALSSVIGLRGIPSVGTSTTSDRLSDKSNYPYFFRVIGPDDMNAKAIGYFLTRGLGYSKVIVVWSEQAYSKAGHDAFVRFSSSTGVIIAYSVKTPEGPYQGAPVMESFLPELDRQFAIVKRTGVKVIVAFCFAFECDAYMLAAEKHGLITGYTWFGMDGIIMQTYPSMLYVAPVAANEAVVNDFYSYFLSMTKDASYDLVELEGPLQFCQTYVTAWADTPDLSAEGTRQDLLRPCYQRDNWNGGSVQYVPSYSEYHYDAFFLMQHLYTLNRNWIRNKRKQNGANVDNWKEDYDPLDLWKIALNKHEMNKNGSQFSFECLTGKITFNEKGDRNSLVGLFNFRDGAWQRVATWSPEDPETISWSAGKMLSMSYSNGSRDVFLSAGISLLTGLPDPGGRDTCGPDQNAVDGCDECEPGYGLFTIDGKYKCILCLKGHFKKVKGQTSCRSCPAGQYSASDGSLECLKCPIGRFTDAPQMSHCKSCDFTMSGLTFYQDEVGQTGCKPCPPNAVCRKELDGPHSGLIITFQAGAGFYKLVPVDSPTGEAVLIECRPPGACLGYDMVAKHPICSDGMDHETPFCGLCQLGYTREFDTEVCKACTPLGFSLAMAILSAGCYLTLLITMNSRLNVRNQTDQRVAFRMLGNFCGLLWVSFNVTQGRNPLPPWFVGILVWASAIIVNSFRHIVSINCIIQSETNFKLLAFDFVYVAIVGGIIVYSSTIFLYSLVHLFLRQPVSLASLFGVCNIVTFVILPFVANVLLGPLRCANLDVPRLHGNYGIQCSDAKSYSEYTLAYVGTFGYCVGFLVFILFLMVRHRRRMHTEDFQKRFGFFVTGYRVEYFWFETYHMLRKVLFPWAALLYDEYERKLIILLCVAIIFLFLQIFSHPYDQRQNNALNRLEVKGMFFLVVHLGVAAMRVISDDFLGQWPRSIIDFICGIVWIFAVSLVIRGYIALIFSPTLTAIFRKLIASGYLPATILRLTPGYDRNPIDISKHSSVFNFDGMKSREVRVLSQIKFEIVDLLVRQGCRTITDSQISTVVENLRRNVVRNIEKERTNPGLRIRMLLFFGVSYADMDLDGKVFVDDLYLELLRFESQLLERIALSEMKSLGVVPVGPVKTGSSILKNIDESRWNEFLCPSDDDMENSLGVVPGDGAREDSLAR